MKIEKFIKNFNYLFLLQSGTSLTPQKNEPPCLWAVGNVNDDKLKLFGYVDGIAMFNNEPLKVLIEMMEIIGYSIFNFIQRRSDHCCSY